MCSPTLRAAPAAQARFSDPPPPAPPSPCLPADARSADDRLRHGAAGLRADHVQGHLVRPARLPRRLPAAGKGAGGPRLGWGPQKECQAGAPGGLLWQQGRVPQVSPSVPLPWEPDVQSSFTAPDALKPSFEGVKEKVWGVTFLYFRSKTWARGAAAGGAVRGRSAPPLSTCLGPEAVSSSRTWAGPVWNGTLAFAP